MADKKISFHYHSLSRLILVVAIVIMTNFILSPVSLRIDLTEAKIYTLSKSTKRILRALDGHVTIKAYFSGPDELPNAYIGVRQDVHDVLDEYKKTGGKNIIIEKLNPRRDEKIAREAVSYGVPEIEFSTRGHKELEIKLGFVGVAVIYKGAFFSIPYIENINNLEFEITSAIQRFTETKTPILGILKGHGEEISSAIVTELKKQYEIIDVNISEGQGIPSSVDGLIVAGAKNEFQEAEKLYIDQFVMRGGKLFLFLDGALVDINTLASSPNNLSLNSLLESYGVTINSDIIFEPKANEAIKFQTSFLPVSIPYPPFPKITKMGMNKTSVISDRIQSVSFPFPSSITIIKSTDSSDKKITPLVHTTKDSFVVSSDKAILVPDKSNLMIPSNQGERVLAVLIQGQITSAFKGKPIPHNKEKKEAISSESIVDETKNGSIFIVSSARFLTDQFISRNPENFALFANALDVLVRNESLIDVRSRSLANRPLENIDEKTAATIKYVNILSGAVLALILGLVAKIYRRRKDARARAFYTV